jgi:hypothetical protein
MESHKPSESDAALRRVLQEWHVDAGRPPRFREQVWQRIAQREAPGRVSLWHALAHWLEHTLPRPAVAVGYVAVLLVAGLGAGYFQARANNLRTETRLQARYLQLVDPLTADRD